MVSIIRDEKVNDYPKNPPFNPPTIYPEYPFDSPVDEENTVYPLIREALLQMGLDQQNIGTPDWNPFREIVMPGTTVLIKPNLGNHRHGKGLSISNVIVHGSVIRPILDYVSIALEGSGKIIVADTPMEKTDFVKLCDMNGLNETTEYLRRISKIPVDLVDLRGHRILGRNEGSSPMTPLSGDELGFQTIDLAQDSELTDLDGDNTNYFAPYDDSVDHHNPYTTGRGAPNNYHNKNVHQYEIAGPVLSADSVISVAKMKTHKRAGVTLNLKNMIGIVHGKDLLPHYRHGSPPRGDAFPYFPPKSYVFKRKFRQKLASCVPKNAAFYSGVKYIARQLMKVHSLPEEEYVEWGSWYGNDTLWRTILDVNKILLYADKDGILQDTRQRGYFCFIDGVIGMSGEGPLHGEAVSAGIILAGNEPVATDAVAAVLMGFDVNKIKTISKVAELERHLLGTCNKKEIVVSTKEKTLQHLNLHFNPPRGWLGHIEI